jgi:hypothetical protein
MSLSRDQLSLPDTQVGTVPKGLGSQRIGLETAGMTPLIAHDVVFVYILAAAGVRWPHERQRRANEIAESYRDWRERAVLFHSSSLPEWMSCPV